MVVGAGILGASIAYHLARRGAAVQVLEKGEPGGVATGASFGWINATFDKHPRSYFELNRRGIGGWRRLEKEIGGLSIAWGGSLEWVSEEARAVALRAAVTRHREWGYGARIIDSVEIRTLEPAIEIPPASGGTSGHPAVAAAASCDGEGSLDPVLAARALLAAAGAHGARVEEGIEVVGLEERAGDGWILHTRSLGAPEKSRRAAAGSTEAEVVIFAAGVSSSHLGRLVGHDLSLVDAPGVLAWSTPFPRRLRCVVLAPGVHFLQRLDGRVVVGSDFGGGPLEQANREGGEALLAEAAEFFPALAQAELERVTVGHRPMPRDGLPVVGFLPGRAGLYAAVMHSGVTLAPIVGCLAAGEILDGLEADLLSPFRPGRFR